jgi:hypothetical protein
MQAYSGAQHHSYLTSALGGGEQSISHPGCFSPGKETGYPLNKRLGGSQIQSGHSG